MHVARLMDVVDDKANINLVSASAIESKSYIP